MQWKLQASTSFRFSFRKRVLIYINPFIPASNQHETYPYDIHTLSRKKGSDNTQSYREEVVISIEHEILF